MHFWCQCGNKKELQHFTSRLAALVHFITHFTDKLRYYFLTLREASTSDCTDECKHAFEKVKCYFTKRPILNSFQSDEQLYMYLVLSDCAVNAIMFRHIRDKWQKHVYYVSKAMVDAKTRYSRMEQMILALKNFAHKLCPYFQAHQVTVLTSQPL